MGRTASSLREHCSQLTQASTGKRASARTLTAGGPVQREEFGWAVLALVAANCVVVGAETDVASRSRNRAVFDTLEGLFVALYTAEIALRRRSFFLEGYNWSDLLIVALAWAQFFVLVVADVHPEPRGVQLLRALKGLRSLMLVTWVKRLRVIASSLVRTLASLASLFLLLVLLMLVFGCVGLYLYGYDDGSVIPAHYWSTLSQSMFTLSIYVTMDGWTDVQQELDEQPLQGSRLFTVVFIFIGSFIFTNLLIGVIIHNLEESTQEDKKLRDERRARAVEQKKREAVEAMMARDAAEQQQSANEALIDQCARSSAAGLAGVAAQLARRARPRHDDVSAVTHMSENSEWMRAYATTLRMYRDESLSTLRHYEGLVEAMSALESLKKQDKLGQ
eukprot:m51a1_g4715 putative cation channel sperm-associated protein 3 (391) ;mRNA; f:299995-301645